MLLTVKQEALPERQVKLDIEIPYAELEAEYTKIKSEWSTEISLPGFRKGKVPVSVVEKRFKPSIQGQVIENLLPKAYEQAVKDQNIQPYGQALAEKISPYEEQKPVTVSFKVTLMPLVELGDTKGIEASEPIVEVTDADIKAEVRSYLRSLAELVETTDADVVTEESWIRIDLKFEEAAYEAHNLIGNAQLIERFDDEHSLFAKTDILGMKKGDTKKIERSFPKEFFAADLAGKKVSFTLTLNEHKWFKLPELTDEIAKKIGFDDLASLDVKVRERLETFAENYKKDELKKQVLEALRAKSKIELPHAMIHDSAHYLMEEHLKRIGLPANMMSRYAELVGKTNKEVHDEFEKIAKTEIANELIAAEIQKVYPAEINDEAMNAEIEKIAGRMKRDAKELRKEMLKSGAFTNLKRRLTEEHSFDLLLAQGKKKVGEKVSLEKILKG
jgi:trigger factor